MAKERRDNKGRLLWKGEYQKEDGRYMYRYIDAKGEARYVYSWTLTQTDRAPKGRTQGICLRELEKGIMRDIQDEIDRYTAEKSTLNMFFASFIQDKRELKQSTRTNYKYMYRKYVADDLGKRRLSAIKYSDIKRFYNSLILDKGFKPNSMETIHTILHPIFATAVRDGYIRVNPTDGVMAEIKKRHDWSKGKRHALTVPEQEAFVGFLRESAIYKKWIPLFAVLLGTGCRVGEVVGLRWEDCDFQDSMITINHSLIYRPEEDTGKAAFHISTPKTSAGNRIIPMFSDVQRILEEEYERQKERGFSQCEVDGYSGFIFTNRFGDPMSPHNINRAIDRICRDYNIIESDAAEKDGRDPILLPHFSVHNLRHTFCTRMCENESNIKVIQEIMGHADIETTLEVYAEATREKKKTAFENLDGSMTIC